MATFYEVNPDGAETRKDKFRGRTFEWLHEWWTRVLRCGHVNIIHRTTYAGQRPAPLDFDAVECAVCKKNR